MTQLVGAAQPQFRLEANERRLHTVFFQMDCYIGLADGSGQTDFRSPWWPRPGFVGDLGVDVGLLEGTRYECPEMTRGMNTRYGVSGVTRDVYGSALPSVTVKLYRTSTDEMVSSIVSDVTTGAFLVSTPYYPDAHYLVAYKAGSPDVQGASVNTLIGQ